MVFGKFGYLCCCARFRIPFYASTVFSLNSSGREKFPSGFANEAINPHPSLYLPDMDVGQSSSDWPN
jgi:hypothetical protein